MDDESQRLLADYVDGNSDAATQIFHRYVARLIALAQTRLSPQLQGPVDPEDIVQSAYRSFFRKAKDEQITLQRSGDLWRVLAAFTLNKTRGRIEKELAEKRDARRTQQASARLDEAIHDEPTPEEVAEVVEQLSQYMEEIRPRDRRILELRLQGASVEEIAAELAEPGPDTVTTPQTVSNATIRRVLREAKKALRQRLFGG